MSEAVLRILRIGRWPSTVLKQGLRLFLTFILALAIGAAILAVTGQSPLAAYRLILRGAFGNISNMMGTLMVSTPLIFTGLACSVAFRAGIFNVGIPGSLYLGAFAAAWVGFTFTSIPGPLIITIAFLFAGLAGGGWGLIPGYLKARFEVNEIVTTLMLNNIAILLTGYLVNYHFLPPGTANSVSYEIDPAAHLPSFTRSSQLNFSLIIALAMVGVVYFLFTRTTLGYEIRMVGDSREFSRTSGINVQRLIMLTMLISGFIGGIAGAGQVLGVNYRFIAGFSPGYGFTGITITLLAQHNPFGVLIAALLFGALRNGGSYVQFFSSVPLDLINIIQGIVIMLVTAQLGLDWLFRRRDRNGN